ncbi:MAG: hypothetical protein A2Y40_03490 [Candidatus Margulisbacteria bacterium GWF2_35_9]|nr:MAG: hypothetical protein A2Y40_03490 [Candidatus Margulisbacteria bacterium GWF2_35_9]
MKIIYIVILTLSLVFPLDKTIDISASAMNFNEYLKMVQMENIINAKTPGYKELVISPIYDESSKQIIIKGKTKFTIGPFINTSKPLDLIIEDQGFFMVADEEGSIYFTRDGRFEMNRNMELTTVSGKFKVLSMEKNPIEIPELTDIKVDSKGIIYSTGGGEIARLGIVKIRDQKKLESVNQVFFYLLPEDNDELIEEEEITIKQGYFEGSNVDYMQLLVKMADTTKYTANTQLIQARLKMIDTMIDLAKQN